MRKTAERGFRRLKGGGLLYGGLLSPKNFLAPRAAHFAFDPFGSISRKVPAPTTEQNAIIKHDLDPSSQELLVVEAFSGTGKTFLLVQYTKARPHLNFLYIAFNKSAAMDAKSRFGDNTRCVNIHALAYRWLDQRLKDKLKDSCKPHDIAPALDLDPKNEDDKMVAGIALATIKNFIQSNDQEIGTDHLPNRLLSDTFLGHDPLGASVRILAKARLAWDLMTDPSRDDAPMTHDAYLKLYALSKPILSGDVILLDEAQDSDPLTMEIVFAQPKPVILVGDTYQSIYQFRGAVNSIASAQASPRFQGASYRLTGSFRFGANVGKIATFLIGKFGGCPAPVRGLGPDKGTIDFDFEKPRMDFADLKNGAKPCFLSRTNSDLLFLCIELCELFQTYETQAKLKPHSLKLGFVGCSGRSPSEVLSAYKFGLVLDVHMLAEGNPKKARSTHVSSFASLEALELSIERDTPWDTELKGCVTAAKRLGKACQPAIIEILNRTAAPDSPDCVAYLSTAHKSKGLEWDEVRLGNDFPPLVITKELKARNHSKYGAGPFPRLATKRELGEQEINLLYIAATRAKKKLRLNKSLAHAIEHIRGLANQRSA